MTDVSEVSGERTRYHMLLEARLSTSPLPAFP